MKFVVAAAIVAITAAPSIYKRAIINNLNEKMNNLTLIALVSLAAPIFAVKLASDADFPYHPTTSTLAQVT